MIVDKMSGMKYAQQHHHRHPGGFEPGFLQRPDEEPVSRTYQYRKVMKPMLERKRRARINRCLDELKELMVTALQAEGENVAKLEKADILELTVRHLHSLRRQGRLVPSAEGSYAEKFKAGFSQCASEVSHFIANATKASPKRQGPAETQAGTRLLQHLNSCMRRLESTAPQPQPAPMLAPMLRSPNHQQHQHQHQQNLQQNSNLVQSRRGYAPPSPPASPASSGETADGHASSMWRPW